MAVAGGGFAAHSRITLCARHNMIVFCEIQATARLLGCYCEPAGALSLRAPTASVRGRERGLRAASSTCQLVALA